MSPYGQLVCGANVVELPDELLADTEHGERAVQRCCEAGNNDNHADDVGSGERYVDHVAGDDGDCDDGDDVLRSRHVDLLFRLATGTTMRSEEHTSELQ